MSIKRIVKCPYCNQELDIDKLLDIIRDARLKLRAIELIGQPCQTCGKPLDEQDLDFSHGNLIGVAYKGCLDCVKKGRYSV
jgi:transcription initiation factor IIE alpha subunit